MSGDFVTAPAEPTSVGPRYGLAIFTFLVMLIGMTANVIFNNLTANTEFTAKSILVPVCISPLVFGAFASIIKSELDFLTGALIAFQNGFFWQQIFDGLAKTTGGN